MDSPLVGSVLISTPDFVLGAPFLSELPEPNSARAAADSAELNLARLARIGSERMLRAIGQQLSFSVGGVRNCML